MRKTIHGRRYDTETAMLLGSRISHICGRWERLYATPRALLPFIVSVDAHSIDVIARGQPAPRLTPVSWYLARRWAVRWCDSSVVERVDRTRALVLARAGTTGDATE